MQKILWGVLGLLLAGLIYFGRDGALVVYTEQHANHCYRIFKRIAPTPDTMWPVAVYDYPKDGRWHSTVEVSLQNNFGARVRMALSCEYPIPPGDAFEALHVEMQGIAIPPKVLQLHNGMIAAGLD